MKLPTNNLQSLYLSGKPVFSLEFFPPKSSQALTKTEELISKLAYPCIDFMTVTYGAGGGTREFTSYLVSFIKQHLNKPAVAHLTCVGHSQAEIAEVLKRLKADGISAILALRGDKPQDRSNVPIESEHFTCARDLISFIKREGGFSIACAGYPEVHREALSPEADIDYLKEKVDAGAEVILTQLFFNPDIYFRFRDKAVAKGITIPIVPGIMPISDVNQLERFTTLCGASIPERVRSALEPLRDNKLAVVSYGAEYASQQALALLKGGAPGIHFYTLNRADQVTSVLSACGAKIRLA